MRAALPLMLMTILMCTGCGNRVSQDMFTYESLTKEDQAFIASQRTRQATGGATTLRKTPRWVYVEGVLVDTNNAQWVWNEGSPAQLIENKTP